MKSIRKRWLGVVQCAVLALLLAGCQMTSVRQNPEFASAKRQIRTVAVLPPDVEHTLIVFDGDNQRIPQREEEIGQALTLASQSFLGQCGYEAKTTLLERMNGSDKALMFDYEQLKSSYTQASKELYQRRMVSEEDAFKFHVGVGALANPLTNASGADALLLMRYRSFEKSSGQQAKEVVASALLMVLLGSAAIPAPYGGSLELVLIDGASGDILWSNYTGAPVKSPDMVFTQAGAPLLKSRTALAKASPTPATVTAAVPATAAASAPVTATVAASVTNSPDMATIGGMPAVPAPAGQ